MHAQDDAPALHHVIADYIAFGAVAIRALNQRARRKRALVADLPDGSPY